VVKRGLRRRNYALMSTRQLWRPGLELGLRRGDRAERWLAGKGSERLGRRSKEVAGSGGAKTTAEIEWVCNI